MGGWSAQQAEALRPVITRYGEESQKEPDRLQRALFEGPRTGGLGLLRDLHVSGLQRPRCISVMRRFGRRGGLYMIESWWRCANGPVRKPTGNSHGCELALTKQRPRP